MAHWVSGVSDPFGFISPSLLSLSTLHIPQREGVAYSQGRGLLPLLNGRSGKDGNNHMQTHAYVSSDSGKLKPCDRNTLYYVLLLEKNLK